MIEFGIIENRSCFNTPTEFGLRALFLLANSHDKKLDIQNLVYLDYILVHSDDIEGGPKGLHAKIPYRSAELFVKRSLIEKGLRILVGRELVEVVFDIDGISYKASELGLRFIELFQSEYAKRLKSISQWIFDRFSSYSPGQLETFINANLKNWGGENHLDSVYRNGILKEDGILYI